MHMNSLLRKASSALPAKSPRGTKIPRQARPLKADHRRDYVVGRSCRHIAHSNTHGLWSSTAHGSAGVPGCGESRGRHFLAGFEALFDCNSCSKPAKAKRESCMSDSMLMKDYYFVKQWSMIEGHDDNYNEDGRSCRHRDTSVSAPLPSLVQSPPAALYMEVQYWHRVRQTPRSACLSAFL